VLAQARGTGLGAALVQDAVARMQASGNIRIIRLGAQAYAIGFYEKLGFRVCGPEYDDAGIPQHEMERTP
jgi:ElaA protein